MSAPEWLRPSALPKLALCGHFRGEVNAGEAAQRGTLLDARFREAIQNGERLVEVGEDEAAINWGLDTARALAGPNSLDATEANLGIECLGMTGTADLLCEGAGWSADLKTGQIRNYVEQQAAYALGFMDRFFCDEWTVYLLYCDQEQVETLRFTRESAETAVRAALANVHDEAPPVANDYCGWCAARFTCPVRSEAVVTVTKGEAPDLSKATGDQLREFVLRAKVVEDYATEAREILKAKCIAGEKIPGVSLTSKQGTKKVSSAFMELHLRELGSGDVLAAYGSLGADKAREIWARKIPGRPFPEDQVLQMPGSTFVRVSTPRAKALKDS